MGEVETDTSRTLCHTSPRGRGREPGGPCEAWLRHDPGERV